jgi:hypothetical protein|nr:hypothetical protein [uncultured Flavobacterium sp.]
MKQIKIFVFTFFTLLFFSNNGFGQSNKSHKDNNGHHNGSKNKSDNEYYNNNSRNNSTKNVKVNDLLGKNPDYVYKELKNRNFIINRYYLDGLTTCKVWHNYITGQCIKTMSLGKKVYSIENTSNCR